MKRMLTLFLVVGLMAYCATAVSVDHPRDRTDFRRAGRSNATHGELLVPERIDVRNAEAERAMSNGFPPDFPIPAPPISPPLMIFYEQITGQTASELRYFGSEVSIIRAHLAARNLINGGNVDRVLLIQGVQEIKRPDSRD